MDTVKIEPYKISIKISSSVKQSIVLAKVAMKNKLYIDDWKFIEWLDMIIDEELLADIGILFYDEIPIALSILLNQNDDIWTKGHIGFFVKEEYRRQGIATLLSKEMLKNRNPDENIHASNSELSGSFFDEVGISTDWDSDWFEIWFRRIRKFIKKFIIKTNIL